MYLFIITILGCGKRYEGGSHASASIPGQTILHCYDLQKDQVGKPLFVIIWKASMKGTCEINGRNQLTSIHNKPIDVSYNKKAIYALQPDYSLKPIKLNESEVDHILDLINNSENPFSKDNIWKLKIEATLNQIEEK